MSFVIINLIGLLTGIMDIFVLVALFTLFFTVSIIVEIYSERLVNVSVEKWGKTFRKFSHLTGGVLMLIFVIISPIQLSWICLSILTAFLFHEYFYVKKQIYSIYTLSLILIGRLDRRNNSKFSKSPRPFYPTLWLLGAIAVIGLFGQKVALAAIVTFAFGDFISTIVGEQWGKHKLPYNKTKSLEGSLAFFLITFAGVYLVFFFTGFDYLLAAVISASVGSIIESLIPTNYWLDDNFAVPVGVGLVLYFSRIF